jgi:hypothetical protein
MLLPVACMPQSLSSSVAYLLVVADEVYREDLVFRDPNIVFKGIENYKLIVWSLRFHGKLFFKKLYVEVIRIWQPEDQQIK